MFCSHWRVLKFIELIIHELDGSAPDAWRIRQMCVEFALRVSAEREELRTGATARHEWRPKR